MIKVSVLYPRTAGGRFDHDYYRDKHMPLLKQRMGAHCRSYAIDRGIGGGAAGTEPPYVAMCHIYCDSEAAFLEGFGPHQQEILADVPHYTDIQPVVQISEVVVG